MYFLCLIGDESAVESALTVCSEQPTDLPSFCDSADGPAVGTSFEHSTPITHASSTDHDYQEKLSSVEDQLDAARNRILGLESQLATMQIERFWT
jgi:hypothetical protein